AARAIRSRDRSPGQRAQRCLGLGWAVMGGTLRAGPSHRNLYPRLHGAQANASDAATREGGARTLARSVPKIPTKSTLTDAGIAPPDGRDRTPLRPSTRRPPSVLARNSSRRELDDRNASIPPGRVAPIAREGGEHTVGELPEAVALGLVVHDCRLHRDSAEDDGRMGSKVVIPG